VVERQTPTGLRRFAEGRAAACWSKAEIIAIVALLLTGAPRPSCAATIEHRTGEIVFSTETATIAFSDVNGSVRSVTEHGKDGTLFQSGEDGLWKVTYREGGSTHAAGFAAGSVTQPFTWAVDPCAETLRLSYANADVAVTVTLAGRTDGIDFSASVEPARKTVLEFVLPARLRFAPDGIERLVCPLNGNESVGAAFKSAFFKPQTADHPAGWRTQVVGPNGYISLFGAGAVSRADNDPPVPIRITTDGRTWLGTNLTSK